MPKTFRLQPLAVALLACALTPVAQAAAIFNPANGTLEIPVLSVDWSTSYKVTLQHKGASAIPVIGDMFSILTVDSTAAGMNAPDGSYLATTGTAYLPEVRGTTGTLSYRLIFQFDQQANALKITHLEENSAGNTNPNTGNPRLVDNLDALYTQIRDTEQPTTCSKATLKGTYSLITSGLYKTAEGQNYPYITVGFMSYDGAGKYVNTSHVSLNRQESVSSGTYEIAANCQGTHIRSDGSISSTFYVPPSGERYYFIRENNGGWIHRVSKSTTLNCSNATLKGTYLYGMQGYKDGAAYYETGMESYDGQGGLTNVYFDSVSQKTTLVKGTYQMDRSCVGKATYASGEGYVIYTEPNGSIFNYMLVAGSSNILMLGGTNTRTSMMQSTLGQ